MATATWVVLSANAGNAETWTFPLLVENPSSCTDVNAIQMDPTLGPVSDVAVASATAPIPRYRDPAVAQTLVTLRITTLVTDLGVSSAVKSLSGGIDGPAAGARCRRK